MHDHVTVTIKNKIGEVVPSVYIQLSTIYDYICVYT